MLVAEQELGQRLGEFGLADARRPEEDERTDGRLGSLSPARVRRIACDTARMASSWPMTRLWSSSSMRRSFCGLFFGELVDGNARPHRQHLGDGFFVDLVDRSPPLALMSASMDSTRGPLAQLLLRSRRRPASSKRWASTASSFLRCTSAISFSTSLKSRRGCMRLMRRREPASSMRSMALSGR